MTHLLIKGMEMPKHGDKLLCIDIWPSGKVSISSDPMCKTVGIAVEIPTPHGRLIDADALANVASQRMGVVNIKHIDDAPTVIEAEK